MRELGDGNKLAVAGPQSLRELHDCPPLCPRGRRLNYHAPDNDRAGMAVAMGPRNLHKPRPVVKNDIANLDFVKRDCPAGRGLIGFHGNKYGLHGGKARERVKP